MDSAKELITEIIDIWTSPVKGKSNNGRGFNRKIELYGVNKLRNLIRGLGLSGKLCSADGNFSKDLEELIADCRKNYSENVRNLKGYSIGEPIISEFSIPNNWVWKRVSDLCDLQTGATPSRQKPEYFGGNNRWLVSGDINLEMIHECEGRITDEALKKSNCRILPEGTVLIALNGQGKTRASVALLLTEAACNQSLVGMIPFNQELLNSEFLLLALKHRYFEIREITGQNKRRGLNMGLVAELSVPLPPIEVQHRIVNKVNELMNLCDQLENDQERIIETHNTLVTNLLSVLTSTETDATKFAETWQIIQTNFDVLFSTESSVEQLKKAILQLAIMGRLVPQNRTEGSAVEELKLIENKKALLIKGKQIKKNKLANPINPEEEPYSLPINWQWCRLEQIGIGSTGKTPKTIERDNFGGDIEFIGPGEITEAGKILNSQKTLTQKGLVKSVEALPKSILMVCIGGSIGKSAIVQKRLAFNQQINAIYPIDMQSKYINIVFSSNFFQLQIQNHATGSATPIINRAKWENLLIPIPPIAEQHRIIEKIDELFLLCEKLKESFSKSQNIKINLADSLVDKAIEKS